MGKSKKRIEIGEEKWAEYQKERNRRKQSQYYASSERHRDKKRAYCTGWRIRIKQELIQHKGGKCELCGYSKDVPGAYAFHHVDSENKGFSISRYHVLNLIVFIEKLKNASLYVRIAMQRSTMIRSLGTKFSSSMRR